MLRYNRIEELLNEIDKVIGELSQIENPFSVLRRPVLIKQGQHHCNILNDYLLATAQEVRFTEPVFDFIGKIYYALEDAYGASRQEYIGRIYTASAALDNIRFAVGQAFAPHVSH